MDQRRREVLQSLSAEVTALTAEHERTAKLWFPTELLTPFFDTVRSAPTQEQIAAIPSTHKAALVLNLLTEDGLPHFHRLVATHLGDEGAWASWNGVWTAEENRHGNALDAYALMTGIVDRLELDRMKHAYIRNGFYPSWQHDPYQLLAYTSLQEYATQMSHSNLSRVLSATEPVLANILNKIAKDETRHYVFYREVFRRILGIAPDEALVSLYAVMRTFAMPGNAMPNFNELALIQERAGIFTSNDYRTIVEQLIKFWNIGKLSPQTDAGQRTQVNIMAFPGRLLVMAQRRQQQAKPRTFEVPFLSEKITI